MTSPSAPEISSSQTGTCTETGCERPSVRGARRCRVHLAEALRAEGETIPFKDPELAGVAAAAIHLTREALNGFSNGPIDASAPSSAIDMYALLDPAADWAGAQVALDTLGARLADTFGGAVVSPPMEFMSNVLLRLQVGVPTPLAEELLPRLERAVEALVREMVGPETSLMVTVQPAEEQDGPGA